RRARYEVRGTIYDLRGTRDEVRFTIYDVRGTMYEVRSTIYDLPMPNSGGRGCELAGEPAARQRRRVNPPENPDAARNCRGRACPAQGLQRDIDRARYASPLHVPIDLCDAEFDCRGRACPAQGLRCDVGRGVRTRADGLKPRLGKDRG